MRHVAETRPHRTIEIDACLGEGERAALTTAARWLSECLESAAGESWEVELNCSDAVRSGAISPFRPKTEEIYVFWVAIAV